MKHLPRSILYHQEKVEENKPKLNTAEQEGDTGAMGNTLPVRTFRQIYKSQLAKH